MIVWDFKRLSHEFETSTSYIVDGVEYPRVTSILNMISKPNLYYWYGKHGTERCQQISAEALKRGNIVHLLVKNSMDDNFVGLKDYSDEIKGCLRAFTSWRQRRTVGNRITEMFLYSKKYGYAGTSDLAVEIDNVVGIIDYKTSKAVYSESFLQVAAYLVAFEEVTGITPFFGGVLRLGKTGRYEYCEFSYETAKEFFHYFLAALELWRHEAKSWGSAIKREEGGRCDVN